MNCILHEIINLIKLNYEEKSYYHNINFRIGDYHELNVQLP